MKKLYLLIALLSFFLNQVTLANDSGSQSFFPFAKKSFPIVLIVDQSNVENNISTYPKIQMVKGTRFLSWPIKNKGVSYFRIEVEVKLSI